MKVLDGIAVFDSNRMRDDQVDDVTTMLVRLVGRAPQGSVKDDVRRYMQMYGGGGVRVKDVCSDLGVSKPAVLEHLRRFESEGKVQIKEETTRGSGSPRKRYFWTEATLAPAADSQEAELDAPMTGRANWQNNSTGIIHHGTTNGAGQCRCQQCRDCFENAVIGEAETAARRSGSNQLAIGAEMRRVRRERAFRADGRALAAGLAARNA
jgi:hypothetical protein